MSRFLTLCFDQSAVYRRQLGEVIVRRAGMPLRRKPTRLESALYLHQLDNYRNIGITVNSPAVKTRYLMTTVSDTTTVDVEREAWVGLPVFAQPLFEG